jgi:thymidine kinase
MRSSYYDKNYHNKSGYLEIILGPMFSGKSTRLIQIYKQYNFCNISVVAINHSIDNRYDDNLLTTHDQIKIPCIKTEKLFDIIPRIEDNNTIFTSDIILINEAQFFPDLFNFVVELLKKNKKIYVCGLDGDFEKKKFGQILDLIPLCDKIEKLTSICSLCKNGTPGIFTMRLSNEKIQTIVGTYNYISVCRLCYDFSNIHF